MHLGEGNLTVTNYELPETRKKALEREKDRNNFYSQRSSELVGQGVNAEAILSQPQLF